MTYCWWHSVQAICSVKGTGGQLLHAGAGLPVNRLDPQNNPHHLYEVRNGRTYCNKVNVAWQLTDVGEDDGGFGAFEWSHRVPRPFFVIICSANVLCACSQW